jgi:DNA-directed RNA polymerase specialized sigma24 family protein
VLRSWPAEARRIFALNHYDGKSVEEIAETSELSTIEVRRILATYERKLRCSLQSFRTNRTEVQTGPCVIEPAI